MHPPRLQKEKTRQGDRQSGAPGKHVRIRPGQARGSESPPELSRGLSSKCGARLGLSTFGAETPGRQQLLPSGGDRRAVLLQDCLQGVSPASTQVSQPPSQGPACLLGCLPQPDRVPLHSLIPFFQTVVLDEKFGKPCACEWPCGFEPRPLRQEVLVQFSHPHLSTLKHTLCTSVSPSVN